MGATRITKFSDIPNPGRTVSILVRASNKLVMEEADRSIHDAMCVIRCLVKERYARLSFPALSFTQPLDRLDNQPLVV